MNNDYSRFTITDLIIAFSLLDTKLLTMTDLSNILEQLQKL